MGILSVVQAPHSGQVSALSSLSIDFGQNEQHSSNRGCAGDAPAEPGPGTNGIRLTVLRRASGDADTTDETDCRDGCEQLAVRFGRNRNRSKRERSAAE